jgi:hypothetical protein
MLLTGTVMSTTHQAQICQLLQPYPYHVRATYPSINEAAKHITRIVDGRVKRNHNLFKWASVQGTNMTILKLKHETTSKVAIILLNQGVFALNKVSFNHPLAKFMLIVQSEHRPLARLLQISLGRGRVYLQDTLTVIYFSMEHDVKAYRLHLSLLRDWFFFCITQGSGRSENWVLPNR